MDSNNILQNRFTSIFGIFMIFVYAALGVLVLLQIIWTDLPPTSRMVLGYALVGYALFRTFMFFRMRAKAKHDNI